MAKLASAGSGGTIAVGSSSSAKVDYLHLDNYGATTSGDNQPAFVLALAALIALGLQRTPNLGLATITCGTTSGSNSVTSAGVNASDIGAYVTGPGIPAWTKIGSVVANTSFTMVQLDGVTPALATATAGSVSLSVGWPIGTIKVGQGRYDINSPVPNFGPFVTMLGTGRAQTFFNFKGSGSCFTWAGTTLGNGNSATKLFDHFTVDGNSASASGRTDATCQTTAGTVTVLDASIVTADAGKSVYGMGISPDTTIASVVNGVSFDLSYKAPYSRTDSLQIGGTRNIGVTISGCEGGIVGEDVCISRFKRTGSFGLYLAGTSAPFYIWNEKVELRRLVLFGNNTQMYAWASSNAYNDWNLVFFSNGDTKDGLVIDASGLFYSTVKIRGNMYPASGQQSVVFACYGLNAGGAGHTESLELDIAVELSGSGSLSQTIHLGSESTNTMIGTYGRLKFGYGTPSQFQPINVSPASGKFEFTGLVYGDSVLSPKVDKPYMATLGATGVKSLVTVTSGSFDLSAGDYFDRTLAANLTVAFSNNIARAQRKTFRLTQAAAGGPYTVSWPNAGSPAVATPKVLWEGGSAPTQSAGASVADLYVLETLDGAVWYGRRIQGA